MEETWKGIIYQGKDFSEFYEVSNTGKIRNSRNKREVKLQISNTGYCYYCGGTGKRKSQKIFRVHRAMMESFQVPNPENKSSINHKDGDKLNNSFDNLEWCTHKENIQHAWDTGLRNSDSISGVNNCSSILKEEDILFIKNNYIPYSRIFGTRRLGIMFNVDHSVISEIVNNKSYKNMLL